MNARHVATQVLTQVIKQRRSLSDCLDNELPKLTIARERALAQAICYGVLRWLPRLQALSSQLLSKPLKEKDIDIQIVIFIGLFQHLYLRIPPHAATAETVEITRFLKKEWASSLVNAVLRNFQRQQAALIATIDQEVTARWAHPEWLLQRLQTDWPHHWEAFAQANNTQPPLTLRINQRCLSRATYLQHLQTAQLSAILTPQTENGITLEQAIEVQYLPGFEQGWFSVQDAAAQWAAPLLDVPAGARVLDACAAPGGKTTHLLERYQIGQLVALDQQPARIALLKANLQRLRLTADVHCADARQPATWWDGQPFERILLDAPCSGSGVIRRHPDIKWLRQPEDMIQLKWQQATLLSALWPLLAKGGKLLYVTCSVLMEENNLQLQQFLATHHDGYEIKLPEGWGHPLPVGRQIFPGGRDNTDGFYYACLSKAI